MRVNTSRFYISITRNALNTTRLYRSINKVSGEEMGAMGGEVRVGGTMLDTAWLDGGCRWAERLDARPVWRDGAARAT